MWLCAYKIPFVLWGSLSVPSVWPAPFDDSRLQIPAFVPVLSCCDFYGRVVWIILHVPFMGSGQLLAVFFPFQPLSLCFPIACPAMPTTEAYLLVTLTTVCARCHGRCILPELFLLWRRTVPGLCNGADCPRDVPSILRGLARASSVANDRPLPQRRRRGRPGRWFHSQHDTDL